MPLSAVSERAALRLRRVDPVGPGYGPTYLNGIAVVFEFETGPSGKTEVTGFEWK